MPRAIWIAVAFLLTAAPALRAQPWIPPRGEGTVSLIYQNYYVKGHFDRLGHRNTNGATHAKAVLTELDLGVTDTFAITLSLPFVASKYTGPPMYLVNGIPTYPGPLDNGTYHGTFQDVRVEARRVWWAGRVAFAPLVGASVPTHDYETHGEAVAGKHRRELQAGGTVGTDFGPVLPGAYAYARYALSTAERQHGFPSMRSNLDLEGGYTLSRMIALRGVAGWQFAHKGPTLPELYADDWLGHDRFIVSSFFNAGGGLTLSISRRAEVHALWIATMSGKGGAHVARMLAVGTTVTFGSGGSMF